VEKGTEIMQVSDPESIIRFAIEKGNVNVDIMERLLAMRTQLQGEFAKKKFDESLAAFQSECPAIQKRKNVMNKDGKTIRYSYAPLDDIVDQVKPLLKNHGFSYSIDIDSSAEKGWVVVCCEITHSAGHSKTSSFKCPIDPQGFMSEPQKYASALTFAKRYAFCNAFGILTADEDNDANINKEKPAGPSKLKTDDSSLESYARILWEKLIPIRGLAKNWDAANKWLRELEFINDTEELPYTLSIDRYKEVIDKSNEYLKSNPLGVKQ
jgi:hypothetical protein